MSAATGYAHDLGIISTLTSLQRLRVHWPHSYRTLQMPSRRKPCSKLVLRLPRLLEVCLVHLEEGELVLACPRLARAELSHARSLRLNVEDAAIEALKCIGCNRVQMAMCFPEDQLKKLKNLYVRECKEIGRHLIEDVDLMMEGFHAARMPRSFPGSLQDSELSPIRWSRDDSRTGGPQRLRDLPGGLKELQQLTRFCFSKLWHMTRPPVELLPMDSLRAVHLRDNYFGYTTCYPQKDKEPLSSFGRPLPRQ